MRLLSHNLWPCAEFADRRGDARLQLFGFADRVKLAVTWERRVVLMPTGRFCVRCSERQGTDFTNLGGPMGLIARTAIVVTAALPLAFGLPGTASAAGSADVSYAFTANGSTVTNTITNNSGAALTCLTALAPAPGGTLPPVEDVLANGQTLGSSGEIQGGVTAQPVPDIPNGTYVVLATCSRSGTDPAMWVSKYPGIEATLAQFPMPGFTVEEASRVVTVPAGQASGPLPDLSSLLGSGSAN